LSSCTVPLEDGAGKGGGGMVLGISSDRMTAQPTKDKASHLHVILKVERCMYLEMVSFKAVII